MNKKTMIGIIIAILVIAVVIVGYAMLNNNETSTNRQGASENRTQVAQNNTNTKSNTTENETNTENTTSNGRTLIAYFSETGNTEKFANIIHNQIGGDLFKIEPVTPYPTGDELFDYTREEQEEDRRPEIQGTVDMSQYDTVFIGYPIWWGIAAWPVDTFVKANDFNGKTVIPFCTSSSSGLGQSGELLAEEANGGNWLEGHRFRSNPSDSDIQEWTDSIQ